MGSGVGVAILHRGHVVHADVPPNPQCYRTHYRFADLDSAPPLDLVVEGKGGCGSGIDSWTVEGYRLGPRRLRRLFREVVVDEDWDGPGARLSYLRERPGTGDRASFELRETPSGAEWTVVRFPGVLPATGAAVERRACSLRRGRVHCQATREPGVLSRSGEMNGPGSARIYRDLRRLEPALRRSALELDAELRAEMSRPDR